eukprot:scaffold533137_cov22-Prasinocladus_malaysianus.AAC.1
MCDAGASWPSWSRRRPALLEAGMPSEYILVAPSESNMFVCVHQGLLALAMLLRLRWAVCSAPLYRHSHSPEVKTLWAVFNCPRFCVSIYSWCIRFITVMINVIGIIIALMIAMIDNI